ncbi:hypothetical protein QTN47_02540 [Danxiaibacter flavus]|uniref:Uncharacterized protein n=1 Tax=Danxiaibacter flavus TaxID=3049108 RepID=A0ABV3Z906_9BACT|nr:hypothetical protein QNM32_02540 [Chitinophagaceae bacterium DXS]
MIRKKSTRLMLAMSCITILLLSAACRKHNDLETNKSPYQNFPSSPIPDELEDVLWFWGGLGPIEYYDRDGHEVGNGTESARQYSFTEVGGQGRLEFTQYLGLRNASDCVTEIYTTKKATVKFEGNDKFTFYPVEGNFKTVKKGYSDNGTTTRKAEGDDLKAETYLWEVKSFDGLPLLYIYNETDVAKLDPVFVYDFTR